MSEVQLIVFMVSKLWGIDDNEIMLEKDSMKINFSLNELCSNQDNYFVFLKKYSKFEHSSKYQIF